MKLMKIIKADLRNYLRSRSDMSIFSFNRVVDMASKRLGAGGIVGITNFHDERYEQFANLSGYDRVNLGNAVYVPERDILIVKGQTIPAKEGFLSAIGIPGHVHIPERLPLEETIKHIQEKNGIIIVPGPYRKYGLGPMLERERHLLERCDAIEVFNGQATLCIPGVLPRKANARAQAWYENTRRGFPHLGAITSSNGSSLREIGRSNSMMQMPEGYQSLRDGESLVTVLRQGVRRSRPESAERYSAWRIELLHLLVVKWYHNLLSYRLRGVPNQHLDHLFTKPR